MLQSPCSQPLSVVTHQEEVDDASGDSEEVVGQDTDLVSGAHVRLALGPRAVCGEYKLHVSTFATTRVALPTGGTTR